MIVVDTNVIAYLYVPGPHTPHAERLLIKEPEWASALLWRSEFRNVLIGYIRRQLITVDLALEVMGMAEAQMRDREYTVASDRIIDLAVRSGCSAYDCEFVCLAEDLGMRLATTDRKLLSAFPKMAIALDNF